MPPIDVVNDANVALKWFHAEGEEEVEPARALLARQRDRTVTMHVLDLTAYELGNALLRGRLRVEAERVATVLEALSEVCGVIAPGTDDLHEAATLASEHDLTFYDAVYAAVARRRGAHLATLDRELLQAGLGRRPSDLVSELPATRPGRRRGP